MSRETVLGAIRSALDGASRLEVSDPDAWSFPSIPEADPLSRFMAEAGLVDAEVVVARAGAWWEVLQPFVLDQRAVFCGTEIAAGRLGNPLADAAEAAADPREVLGLVRATHGLAESGTVVVDIDGDHLPSLLTEVSAVLLDQSDILAGLEDLPPAGGDIRSRVLITGPSRSADIEKRLVLGAHGPRRLIIVIVQTDVRPQTLFKGRRGPARG